ncbi:tetratricopeptide repeat protein [Nannocystis radixulma]|uniref:Serine/threonine-protein kinase n=1 Tax=Nannocystis radixulma TaxID=2995305 RepID=A0ABT5BFZ9_9BACT|nr:serine/threonine-protein kinase [Nannocystis radixulma]MDC0672353.1 serine/threonine-protein kinase [Nannocystis radixulma]
MSGLDSTMATDEGGLTPSQELGSLASVLVALARTESATLTPGTLVADQYRIERPIGEGGMGVVFLARDIRLDREVAVKVCSGLSRSAVHRIQREAMALAKLAHPNVVVVFQAGEFDGRFFIAMEYVAGGTARSWLAAAPRRPREIVALYLEAGTGLAAAHAAGLIHRDFKPDNVLVGSDGRVRVADFGLARAERDGVEVDPSVALAGSLANHATVASTVAGTPAYMAPEQRRGETLDARADQFAFCVALWEALTGRRPDDGEQAGLPAWIARVLRRGLEPDSERRFASMKQLLAALRDDPRVRRRRWLVGGAVAAALGSSLAAAAGAFDGPPLCAAAGAPLAGVWDGPRREAVASAFAAACAGAHACPAESLERTAAELDRYARAWAQARVAGCEATHVHGVQSAELLDRRMLCLDERLRALDALVDVLASADAGVVREAPRIAAGLPLLSSCADPAHLMARLAPPASPSLVTAVEALRTRLAQAHALSLARRDAEASAAARQLLADATALGYAPLRAEVEAELGEVLWLVDPAASERHLLDAFFTATAHEHDAVAARAAASLVWTLGYVQSRTELAELWARHALAATERRGTDVRLRVDALTATAALHDEQGRHEEALALQDRALALLPEDDGNRPGALSNRAGTLEALGRYAEAQAAYELVLAGEQRVLGPLHPQLARTFSALGLVRTRQGLVEEAVELQRKALAIVMAGPEAVEDTRWDLLLNLGIALTAAERVDEALPMLEEALTLATRLLGPEHPHVGLCLSARANALRDAGRANEAIASARAALELFERSYGPDHDEVYVQQSLLAQAFVAAGRPDEALPWFARAIAGWSERGDAAHPRLVEALVEQGDALLLLGRADEAAAAFTRALDIAGRSEIDADTRARATDGLARAGE